MRKENIKIVVYGAAGSGKSTIIKIISIALYVILGVNIEIDSDVDGYKVLNQENKNTVAIQLDDNLVEKFIDKIGEKRIKSVREQIKCIRIIEKQVKKLRLL